MVIYPKKILKNKINKQKLFFKTCFFAQIKIVKKSIKNNISGAQNGQNIKSFWKLIKIIKLMVFIHPSIRDRLHYQTNRIYHITIRDRLNYQTNSIYSSIHKRLKI